MDYSNTEYPGDCCIEVDDTLYEQEDFQNSRSFEDDNESNCFVTTNTYNVLAPERGNLCHVENDGASMVECNKLTTASCRLCLTRIPGILKPIFKSQRKEHLYEKCSVTSKLSFVAPTIRKIKQDDGYPQFICLTCIAKLDVTFGFLQTVLACDKLISKFCPQANGVLIRKTSLKPQKCTEQQPGPSAMFSNRTSYRRKQYVAKDLVQGVKIVENIYPDVSKKKSPMKSMKRNFRKYKTKDMIQRKAHTGNNKRKKKLKSGEMSLQYNTEESEILNANREHTQLISLPVVKLYVNNILFCIKCKKQTSNGICSKCGPISELLLRCRRCRQNFQNPVKNTILQYLCLPCHEDFVNCCLYGNH